ncbi:hypothetical protein CPL00134L_CDS0022 [Escherichia phage Phagiculus]
MTNQLYAEAFPWIIWSLGFIIVYMIASATDDQKAGKQSD